MSKTDSKQIYQSITNLSSDLIEEAFEPMKHERKNHTTWLKRVSLAAGGLAAAFVLMVGVCCAFPALAANIPGMESIVTIIKGREAGLAESGTLESIYSNFRYYDDWREAGIADEDLRETPEYYERMMKAEDQTFVLCDVTINARELVADHRVDMSKITADNKEDGDLVLWIFNICRPWLVQGLYEGSTFIGELDYFSLHSSSETDYYHFAIGPNETLTVQIGFFAPTSELESGNVVLASGFDSHNNSYKNQYPVPPKS